MLLPMMRERLLTALAGTPDVLDGLLRPLGPNDGLWDRRPDPARFTLREALAHLVDYEAVWRERFLRTREEERPELPSVDRDRLAVDNNYAHSNPAVSRAAFRQQRSELVDSLRELSPEDWQRVSHWAGPGGGPLTLEEQAAFVVIHDSYHTQQVAQWAAQD